MRFPIRSQILLPTSIVMIVVVCVSAVINTWLAQRSARDRIQQRVEEVSKILEHASFPLTDRVLEQMAGLAGAEFVLMAENGATLGTSNGSFSNTEVRSTDRHGVGLGEIESIAGNQYFHQVLPLNNGRLPSGLQLHAFFSANEYRRLWRRSLLPSMIAVGAALAAALVCAYWVGGSVSRATRDIMDQLACISEGDFQPSRLPRKDDELRDISRAVNHTATLLSEYEAHVREGERMKTMVAMGAGLAHQIRNSVTGCRMALDIFAEENSVSNQEALQVARRQLSLMENYLQRFLLLAKVEPYRDEQTMEDLNEVVDRAVSLVQHSARHLKVTVQWGRSPTAINATGDMIAVEQALVNLLLNAIEAASTSAAIRTDHAIPSDAYVRIGVRKLPHNVAMITVSDNGSGPSDKRDVFAPFVSEKTSGIGLGLAVVKEVAVEHGGRTSWQRSKGWTEFVLELPCTPENS